MKNSFLFNCKKLYTNNLVRRSRKIFCVNYYSFLKIVIILFLGLGGSNIVNAQWLSTTGTNGLTISCFYGNTNYVLAGTLGSAIYKSIDAGSTWNKLGGGLPYNIYINDMVMFSNKLYAASNGSGIYISSDNGATWATSNTGLSNLYVRSIEVMGTTLYAGTNGGGMFKSTNNGISWAEINTGLTNNKIWSLTSTGSCLFAATYGGGVFKSSNSGISWSAVNNGISSSEPVWIIAANGNNIYAGTTGGLFYTSDYGSSWSNIFSSNVVYSIMFFNNKIIVGSWAYKLYITADHGLNWVLANDGLPSYTSGSMDAFHVIGNNILTATPLSGVWTRQLNEFTKVENNNIELIDFFYNTYNKTIKLNNIPENTSVFIYDISGKLLIYEKVNGSADIIIDRFTKGIYIAKIQNDKEVIVQKFIKE